MMSCFVEESFGLLEKKTKNINTCNKTLQTFILKKPHSSGGTISWPFHEPSHFVEQDNTFPGAEMTN